MKPIIKILFLAALLALPSCTAFRRGEGSATVRSETRELYGFREINAGNNVNLEISLQKDFGVTVEADESVLKNVKTGVSGETLVISSKDIASPRQKINVRISMWEMKNLEIWGASTAVVTGVKNEALRLKAAGTSKMTVAGETKNLRAEAVGDSTIDAAALKTEKTAGQTTGSSSLTVFVSDELVAEALGSSRIFYLGEPKGVRPRIFGSSLVEKK